MSQSQSFRKVVHIHHVDSLGQKFSLNLETKEQAFKSKGKRELKQILEFPKHTKHTKKFGDGHLYKHFELQIFPRNWLFSF